MLISLPFHLEVLETMQFVWQG